MIKRPVITIKPTLFFISILPFFTYTAQAANTAYTADILSNGLITLTVNTAKGTYQTGNNLDLKEGDKICFVAGEGFVSIEGGKSTFSLSHENPKCKTLPDTVKLAAKPFQIKLKKSELSVVGTTRGTELFINRVRIGVDEGAYTSPIYADKKGNLRIESKSWITSASRLPIVLRIFDKKDNQVNRFVSNATELTVFALPKRLLADKNGYTLKVTNQRGNTMIQSVFYIGKPQ
jgi:hypothetical protein